MDAHAAVKKVTGRSPERPERPGSFGIFGAKFWGFNFSTKTKCDFHINFFTYFGPMKTKKPDFVKCTYPKCCFRPLFFWSRKTPHFGRNLSGPISWPHFRKILSAPVSRQDCHSFLPLRRWRKSFSKNPKF